MSYIILNDFKSLIQSQNLMQILGNDLSILATNIQKAQKEAISYLVQKYLTAQEFQDTNEWDPTLSYKATNRVYLDAAAYVTANTYNVGALTLEGGNVYQCNTANTTGVFAPANWNLLGAEYAIFYVDFPNPLFNLNNVYAVGDIVFWGTSSWQCLTATIPETHIGDLQAIYSQQIPATNSFPGSSGQTQWQAIAPIPYVVPAATSILNTTYWTPGDNRNPQLVGYTIDIAVYHATPRLAPNNIPDIRVKRYDDAIKWLKDAGDVGSSGITADLPVKQPKSGGRIRWGGNVRRANDY